MTKAPPYTMTNESITIVWNGKPSVVKKESPNFIPLRKAIMEEAWDDIEQHLTVHKSIQTWSNDKFTLEDRGVTYMGELMPSVIGKRILSMASAGENPTPVFLFWEKLIKNPSKRSVDQLWGFLEHRGIPLTEDGCFLAYKGVRTDYKDQHSGTIDNSPGKIVKMPRNQISDDPKEACHQGLHVGALNYASSFGPTTIICKVDPEHVVCVPYDHSQEKMRVCEYEVIGNHGGELSSTVHQPDRGEGPKIISMTGEGEPGDEVPFADVGDDDSEPDVFLDEEGDPIEPAAMDSTDDDEEVDEEKDPTEMSVQEALEDEDDDDPLSIKDVIADAKKNEPKPKVKPKTVVKPVSNKNANAFRKYKGMNTAKLMDQSIDDLRKYATYGLNIIGASKIPGGKTALVAKITKIRK